MNMIDYAKMEVRLVDCLAEWWDSLDGGGTGHIALPIVGGDIHHHMAQAAMAVLKSVDDTQTYLRNEKMLKD